MTDIKPVEQARDVQEDGYKVEETPVGANSGVTGEAVSSTPSDVKETEVKPAVPVATPAASVATPAPVVAAAPANGTTEKIAATEKPAQATQTAPAGAVSTGKNTTAPKKKKGGLFAACCGKGDHIE